MVKKTMFVVGAIVAAAMSMSDAASAAPHHLLRVHRIGIAARASYRPHLALPRTSVRLRPARSRLVAAHYERLLAPVVPAHHRLASLRHVARRDRVASIYRPLVAYGSGRALVQRRRAGRERVASAYHPILPLVAASAPAASCVQTGRASFYHGGGLTAAGSRVGAATCAHRWLPFGTKVLVTNLANARRAVLTVNDRGPFVGGRIVDVSMGAAGLLGMLHTGTAPVSVQVVGGRG